MPVEWIHTLLVLGAAQGLFLSVLLATHQANSAANRLLAAAMLAFSLFLLLGVSEARGFDSAWPHLIGAAKPLIFVFGPVLYLYAQRVSAGGRGFEKAALLHFVPFALVTLYLLPFYLKPGAAKLAFLQALRRDGPPLDVALIDHLQYLHGLVYAALTIRLLRRHRARLQQTHSSVEHVHLLWLRNLTIGIVAVWALATALHLFELAGLPLGEAGSSLTPLAVAVMVYALGYLGLRQPEIFHPPAPAASRLAAELVAATTDAAIEPLASRPLSGSSADTARAVEPPAAAEASAGYEKSGLTRTQAEACVQQLARLMDEKQLYRRHTLTLPELAAEMSVSAHNLSEIINTLLGKNFYDLVNGYRAEDAKRRLRDPRCRHLTILAIAEESGFNSKSTFNAYFKKHTGLTPSQYRAQPAESA